MSGAPVEPAPASFASTSGPKIVPAGYQVAPGFVSPEARLDDKSMTSKVEYSTKNLKIELEFDPQPSKDGSVDLELTLSPKTDLHGEVKAKVHINPSSSSGRNAKVANGQTKSFKMALSSFSGKADITVDLSALKQTANLATPTFLKLSAGIPIPFPIAGIPFTITVKADHRAAHLVLAAGQLVARRGTRRLRRAGRVHGQRRHREDFPVSVRRPVVVPQAKEAPVSRPATELRRLAPSSTPGRSKRRAGIGFPEAASAIDGGRSAGGPTRICSGEITPGSCQMTARAR